MRKNIDKSFAEKMRKLRKEKKISLEEISKKTGLPISFLTDIEEGKISPSVSDIIQISKVFSIDSGAFLSVKEREKKRIESYTKRSESYSYKVLTPDAKKTHLKAFLVTIEPKQDHKMVEYHHEGEEFIYVLEGVLEIIVGKKRRVLKKGESIHFNSEITHKLKNLSSQNTQLIVVIYTP
jgi:transcriptional regulator with XRE-family HTH domain